ncbi:MAG: pseudouridine synthase [Candidatus Pseudobacter hemicellulosilyticus]|uniref:Pseudouridine synthase n=1 Tax=Candidatus Pseudobacter hemicellulosilyticus TaxID=3121375 RepID=A0AAJ6BI93_9BACT|nr:MAG: pseudouridine synthase [Pseudobacter sp.]
MLRYFIIYKPFEVLSQFSPEAGKQTLKDHFKVPPDVYPVGRLDFDSEGLLLLTNDKQINHRLLNPSFAHEREYLVQVDGAITAEAIRQLETGVTISVDGKPWPTRPGKVILYEQAPVVPERYPPVRYRKLIPTSWISLALTEGKNRQVRKMTARTGFPTLRLIRIRIGQLTLADMQPGEMMELKREFVYQALFDH